MTRAISLLAAFAALALIAPAVALAGAPPCRPDFIAGATYPIDSGVVSLAASDLNGDGFPDLIVATNGSGGSILVRLGAADGTFGPALETPTNGYIASSVTANFTNDSFPDVIVTTYAIGGLQLYAGNGDGSFQAPVSIGAPPLYSMAAADMNGDGKLDLVGIRFEDGVLVVLPGNGDGTFGAAIPSPLAGSILAFAVGDVDGDGIPDVVATLQLKNYVSVLLGTGDGHLDPPTAVVAGSSLGAIAVADLNGDGHLDIAVASGDYAAVLLGNGDGTFAAARDYPAGQNLIALVVADFDGDGQPDLAAFSQPGSNYSGLVYVGILRGAGGGAFDIAGRYLVPSGGHWVVAADFANDGRMDLAAVADYTQNVSVLLNFGDGSFRALPLTPVNTSMSVLVAGDFNEDGLDDVVLDDGYTLVAYLSDGRGGFTPGPGLSIGGSSVYSITSADFDGDGHLDVALTFYSSNGVFIFLGNGDGSFHPGVILPISTSSYAHAIATGDFDGDGRPDLAVSDPGYGGTGNISIFLGSGNGLFGLASVQPADPNIVFLLAGDFNGDGLADLAAGAQSAVPAGLSVFLSQGGGTLGQPVAYATGNQPQYLVAGDFRHSGHLDLVAGGLGNANLAFLAGQGDGTFTPATAIALPNTTVGLSAADFDGDGNLDLVSASYGSGTASFLYGLGDGTFQPPVNEAVGVPFGVTVGDFDGNGHADAAFQEFGDYSGAIATLMNGGLGARVGSASVVVGSAAVLRVSAGGYGPLTYQWRSNGTPLADGGRVSGATTSTLTIDPAAFTDAGSYDVLVTDSCGGTTSSPGTLSVEFADVPLSNIFHDDIIAIATAGITAGCGGANYCPTALVTRAQMAVFLLKSEHGSGYLPPACSGVFTDVPCPSPFANWIEQLANESVTAGCGGGNYCPDASVTRAQMAVFLLKTKLGSGYIPPPWTPIFGDVPSGAFADVWIDDLYNRAIAGGCSASPLLYCPGNPVNRAQMATFLVKTFAP